MSSLQTTPYVRDIVESYVHYRKVAGLKPLGRSHKVYQLLYHAVQRTQGMLTPELLAWWWKKRATEQPQSHLARVLEVVPMLRYAAGRWNIPQIPALPEKGCVVQRAPHIFTREELTAFFQACDTMHKPRRNRESLLTELEVPVMFRLMYANGLRPKTPLAVIISAKS